jgi:hypothetical protein
MQRQYTASDYVKVLWPYAAITVAAGSLAGTGCLLFGLPLATAGARAADAVICSVWTLWAYLWFRYSDGRIEEHGYAAFAAFFFGLVPSIFAVWNLRH